MKYPRVAITIALLGAVCTCQAQMIQNKPTLPVRTVCVAEQDADVRNYIEGWLQSKNVQVVPISDCPKADAAISLFADTQLYGNQHGVGYVPNGSFTISFQSHEEGEVIGGMFVGKMLWYGNTVNIVSSLKNILKVIQKSHKLQQKVSAADAKLIEKGLASKCAVVTIPPGATIYIDAKEVGISPMTFVLLKRGDNERTLTVKLNGYKTVEKQFIPDGTPISLSVTLKEEN